MALHTFHDETHRAVGIGPDSPTMLTYNSTNNATFCSPAIGAADDIDSRGIWGMKLTIVTSVSILVVLSNAINITILSKKCHIPKISRLFLLNLSCGDLFVGIISCVPTIVPAITGSWPYGAMWCQIAGIVHGTSVTISIWSLSMISIDRYLAICKPMTYVSFRSSKRAYFVIATMWILALLTFFSPLPTKPNFVYYQYSVAENICGLYWEYKWFCVITAVYIPLLSGAILIFTNVKIMRKILGRRQNLEKVNGMSTLQRRGANAVKMLVITTSFYFLAWGPYVTEVVLMSFVDGIHIPPLVRFFTLWLANSNSFVNVLIFSFVYRAFRYEIKLLLIKLFCCLPLQQLQLTHFMLGSDNTRTLTPPSHTQHKVYEGVELRRTVNIVHDPNSDIIVALERENDAIAIDKRDKTEQNGFQSAPIACR